MTFLIKDYLDNNEAFISSFLKKKYGLSETATKIMFFKIKGYTTFQIAEAVFRSHSYVKTVAFEIRRKLNLKRADGDLGVYLLLNLPLPVDISKHSGKSSWNFQNS